MSTALSLAGIAIAFVLAVLSIWLTERTHMDEPLGDGREVKDGK